MFVNMKLIYIFNNDNVDVFIWCYFFLGWKISSNMKVKSGIILYIIINFV